MSQKAGGDRRVARTHSVLHEAMASLFHEREYGGIVVKEILARANVGRSTFYTHFRDKDELLRSSVNALLDTHCAPPARSEHREDRIDALLAFSLPILEHIAARRAAHSMPSQSRSSVHAALECQLAERLAVSIAGSGIVPALPVSSCGLEPVSGSETGLLSAHIAATFVRVVEWYADRRDGTTAEQADRLFQSLVRPVLETLQGRGER